jgi:hypothetical protein
MRSVGFPELLVLLVVRVVFGLLPFWKIFSKAGYPGVMAFTMFVPIVNLIVLFYLAFAEWPVLRELDGLRKRNG